MTGEKFNEEQMFHNSQNKDTLPPMFGRVGCVPPKAHLNMYR